MNIYIASPLRGSSWERNLNMAACACYKHYVSSIPGKEGRGIHDVIPKIYDDSDPVQRKQGIEIGQAVLRACDELYCCGKVLSEGMREEVELALSRKMPVVCFSEEMHAALKNAGLQHMLFDDLILSYTPIEIVIDEIEKRGRVTEEELRFLQEGREKIIDYFKKKQRDIVPFLDSVCRTQGNQ